MSEPSFSNGFASPWYGGRMKYPDLWRGCVGAWAPLLGPTGATLFAQDGRCNHATITNPVASPWVIGRYGHALDLSGSTDYVSIPYSAEFNSTAIAFSVWFRTTAAGTNLGIVSRWQNTSGGYSWVLTSENGTVVWYINGVTNSGFVGSGVNNGEWQNLTCSYDRVKMRVWQNGKSVFDSAQTAAWTTSSEPIEIGIYARFVAGYGQDINMQLASFSHWNRAIADGEAMQLAQRPGIMYELDDSDVWGAVEAGGSVPWWAFANRQSRIIGGGVT